MQNSEARRLGDLSAFIENVIGDETLRIEERLGAGFVRLKVSEAQRRQAKQDIQYVEDAVCELVRNSRDAHASRVFVASTREGTNRSILVVDDGDGVPPELAERIFEPRVTSKLDTMHMDKWGVHGRGMALYSIKLNAVEAGVVRSGTDRGCIVKAVFDTTQVPERADQSTLPVLSDNTEGERSLTRGPHNIIRTVAEIALDCTKRQKYFIGSPADILATLVFEGRRCMELDDLDPSDENLPYWLGPALATSPKELNRNAAQIGINVSERTCYRILNGDIVPVQDIRMFLHDNASGVQKQRIDLLKDRRGLKVTREDLGEFSESLREAFDLLSQRYYIDLADAPKIKVGSDKVTVTFSFQKQL